MTLNNAVPSVDVRTTRRTVVAAGVKLVYAAPLVAATLKVGTHTALAQAFSPLIRQCFSLSVLQQIHPTGLHLSAGNQVQVTASGNACFCAQNAPECCNGPDGDGGIAPPSFPAPGLAHHGLVARVGGGPYFDVGSSEIFTASAAGELIFAVQDDRMDDNSGAWNVCVGII